MTNPWGDQGGFEFRGRADMTTKVNGKWVDLLNIEERLHSIAGVSTVAVLPDPLGSMAPP